VHVGVGAVGEGVLVRVFEHAPAEIEAITRMKQNSLRTDRA
jgi:hypothetical protein